DFHRIADVGRVVRRLVATRRIADVQAVDREARLDAAAAVHGKDREHRTGVDVGDVRLQARHGCEQIAVAADAGKVPHRLVVERDGAPVLCTSTIGDSPVTVTVSATVPILISASILTTPVPDTMTSSRFKVANPVSVNVTL